MADGFYNSSHTGAAIDAAVTKATTALTDAKAYVDSKVKTDVPVGAKFTDTVYTHPTGAGYNHLPTGGSVGQILKNTASGTAAWQDLPADTKDKTAFTGILKGDGTNISAATAGTDYAPAYQYSTIDLTAGASALATGKLYFVYE